MIKENNLQETEKKDDQAKKKPLEQEVKMVEISMSKQISETTTLAKSLFKNVNSLS
jgi:hypothetical protein